jgi:hypothetical protein
LAGRWLAWGGLPTVGFAHVDLTGRAPRLDLSALAVDHVVVVASDVLVKARWCIGQQVAALCTVQRWTGTPSHTRPTRRFAEPGCAVDDEELGPPNATRRPSVWLRPRLKYRLFTPSDACLFHIYRASRDLQQLPAPDATSKAVAN